MSAGAHNTAARVEMLRLTAEALRGGDLTRADLVKLLKVSDSGMRNYLAELLAADQVEIVGGTQLRNGLVGNCVYRLRADADVEVFLEAARTAPRGTDARPRVSRDKRLANAGRRIHLMEDDAPFVPKLHYGPVLPDPFALPAAFFASPAAAPSAA